MKSVFIVLMLFIAINSWGAYKAVQTDEDINSLPVIAFISEDAGQITYELHFRDIGRLKGLSCVTLAIAGEDETSSQCLFFGQMAIFDNIYQGVKSIQFVLQENLVQRSRLEIFTSQKKGPSYRIPMRLIHSHFKENITLGLVIFDGSSAIENFLKKEFEGKELNAPTNSVD